QSRQRTYFLILGLHIPVWLPEECGCLDPHLSKPRGSSGTPCALSRYLQPLPQREPDQAGRVGTGPKAAPRRDDPISFGIRLPLPHPSVAASRLGRAGTAARTQRQLHSDASLLTTERPGWGYYD